MTFFKTIRSKLLFSFGIFILINCLVIVVNLLLDQKRNRMDQVILTLQEIKNHFARVNRLEKDFFNDETINVDYYETGKSEYLNERIQEVRQIQESLQSLIWREDIEALDVKRQLVSLSFHLNMYNRTFDSLTLLIRKRGFKDYGVEGKMRTYIHDIEAASPPLNLAMVLMIRRHEKDFILRKQGQYIVKLNNAVALLKSDVDTKIPNAETRKTLTRLLEDYRETFNELVRLERGIGLDKKTGVRGTLATIANNMQDEIEQINERIRLGAEELRQTIFITSLVVMGLSVLSGILIAVFITQLLSKPIRTLSRSIEKTLRNDFKTDPKTILLRSQDEVGMLANDFSLMLRQVQASLSEVRNKSQKIEEKQKLLLDSIRYAQKIQNAFLPHADELHETLGNYFIFYEPLHVVSGDFYWIGQKYDQVFVAVVDCTGHGVPGAFMSMIGSSLLSKIVLQEKVFDPAEILERLHQEVKLTLHQEKQSETDDGMEAGLCRWRKTNDETPVQVAFAGARSPLFYTSVDPESQEVQVVRVKGTKRAIGGKHKSEQRPFQTEWIEIVRGQMIYLTSDGLADQHNKQEVKYGKKRLQELFARLHPMPTEVQRDVVQQELYEFMHGQVQRDDITVMGLRF